MPANLEGYSCRVVFPLAGEERAIFRYRQWLSNQARQARRNRGREKRDADKYELRSLRALTVRNREIRPFAPFNDDLSALRTFTGRQALIIVSAFLAVVACFVLDFDATFMATGILLSSAGVLYNLVLLLLSAGTFRRAGDVKINDGIVHALADAEWPTYTILCPLYKEAKVVRQLVKGLQKLDYPVDRLEVFLQVEEYDDETLEALRQMTLPEHFRIILLPPGEPRTKARSCNYALLKAAGEYLVIYDAEDIPEPLQLKKAVLAFAEGGVDTVCVQAKLNFYNPDQNLLTRWFTAEYSARYDLTLPALYRTNLTIPLGGGSNHFRTAQLRRLGAWDVYNVTEDCDLGMRMGHYRLKTALLDSTTYEEANSELGNWLRQRSRWIKGFMQTYLVYMRAPWQYAAKGRWSEFFSLQFVVGGSVAAALSAPLLVLVLAGSIILWLAAGRESFLLMGGICFAALLLGAIFAAALACLGCVKRRRHDLLKWMALHPVYGFLTGIAALIAAYQLVVKPHYWEKTDHGSALDSAILRKGRKNETSGANPG